MENLCIVNYVYASRPQNMCNTGRKRTQIIICTYKASLAVIRKYLLVGSRNIFNSIFHALCMLYYSCILYNFSKYGCWRQLQLCMAEKLAKPKVCPFSNISRLCLSRVTHMSQSHAFCARKHWKIIKMDVCIVLLLKMVSSVFGWVFSAADIEP